MAKGRGGTLASFGQFRQSPRTYLQVARGDLGEDVGYCDHAVKIATSGPLLKLANFYKSVYLPLKKKLEEVGIDCPESELERRREAIRLQKKQKAENATSPFSPDVCLCICEHFLLNKAAGTPWDVRALQSFAATSKLAFDPVRDAIRFHAASLLGESLCSQPDVVDTLVARLLDRRLLLSDHFTIQNYMASIPSTPVRQCLFAAELHKAIDSDEPISARALLHAVGVVNPQLLHDVHTLFTRRVTAPQHMDIDAFMEDCVDRFTTDRLFLGLCIAPLIALCKLLVFVMGNGLDFDNLPWDVVRHVYDESDEPLRRGMWAVLAEFLQTHRGYCTAQAEVFCKAVLTDMDLLICGRAGVGKSYCVLDAIRALEMIECTSEECDSFGNRLSRVVVCAPTQATAAALNGDTIASLFGYRPVVYDDELRNHTIRHDSLFARPEILRTKLANMGSDIDALIDEVRAEGNMLKPLIEVMRDFDERKRALAEYTNGIDDERDGTNERDGDADGGQKCEWVPFLLPRAFERLRNCSVLFIDECFMKSGYDFEQLVSLLRRYREDGRLPRMVLLGDFFQVQPFRSKTDKDRKANILDHAEKVFDSHTFKELYGANFEQQVVEITKVKRTNDREFIDLLGRLRNSAALSPEDVASWHRLTGQHSVADPNQLRDSSSIPTPPDDPSGVITTAILGYRHAKDGYPMRPYVKKYNALVSAGRERWTLTAEDIPSPIGSKVPNVYPKKISVFRGQDVRVSISVDSNDKLFEIYEGVVVDVKGGSVHVQYKERNGDTKMLVVKRMKISRHFGCQTNEGTRVQFPIRPRVASTCHANQGMTLRRYHNVYVENVWDRHMVYTALSRASDIKYIVLCGDMSKISTKVDPEYVAFQEKVDELRLRKERTGQRACHVVV